MKIVGREREIEILQRCLESPKPEFLAVYGRRRVGKTFLIREFFEQEIVFEFTGSEKAGKQQQLDNFTQTLLDYGLEPRRLIADWYEAFRAIREVVENSSSEKKVVFIDELPWLATERSEFPSALEYFWNSWGSKRSDLLLVVCGSATSWMLDNVIHEHGGLYGRVTRQLSLEPFSLHDCEEFFKSRGIELNRYQIAELYMVLGGIPYYLDYVDKGIGPAQCIDRMFFAKHAPLKREFDDLYASLFRKPEKHRQITLMLGKHPEGMTRDELIKATTSASGGQFSKVLRELEQCGFVESVVDFTRKSNDRYYKLIDFFTMFYVKHMHDNEGEDDWYWQNMSRKGEQFAWYGLAFERLSWAHISQIKRRLGIAGVSTRICAWRSRKSKPACQIDLIIKRADRVINLCEMKFSVNSFAVDQAYDTRLRERRETFRAETETGDALHTTLITTYGLASKTYYGEVQSVVTLDDLFAKK